MLDKTCGVRMFKGPCDCEISCNRCRIGCFRPARYKNPFFDKVYSGNRYSNNQWRVCYSYAEYLCAECYDIMVSRLRVEEDTLREEDDYEENPEFTAILKTL